MAYDIIRRREIPKNVSISIGSEPSYAKKSLGALTVLGGIASAVALVVGHYIRSDLRQKQTGNRVMAAGAAGLGVAIWTGWKRSKVA